jgi:hypothetical protein
MDKILDGVHPRNKIVRVILGHPKGSIDGLGEKTRRHVDDDARERKKTR